MPKTYIKDGIIYFNNPYKVDVAEWNSSHEGLNSIVLTREEYDETTRGGVFVFILCYASEEQYNSSIANLYLTMTYSEPISIMESHMRYSSMFSHILIEEV